MENDKTLSASEPRPAHLERPSGIGPYKLLSRLGEGGMGEVWLAEQNSPRREVAIKLIKRGMDTRQVIARFETERQALAVMDHSSIAKVFDAGEAENGTPYFVMEYVKGEPITTYCDRNRLTTEQRLELFIKVCDGVQHAHQKAVIHRDLKPSNILVTVQDDRPLPKIIDFGVAKATGQRMTEHTLFTQLGQLIGTPEYMSPEQAEMTGTDVDTRTDVYSLGVVLYELLTGVLPFDAEHLRAGGVAEMKRRLREDEPSKPSTRVTSLGVDRERIARGRGADIADLARSLSGDLDWITLKALEKDRTRRYGTPAELAADIRRHLELQPVEARPPNSLYRVGRFARRHRFGVAAFVLALVGLVVFTTVTLVQSRRVATALDLAEKEAAKAKAVNDFLRETLGSANPTTGGDRDVTLLETLAAARERIDESLRDQPEVEASVRLTLGATYRELGQLAAAEPLLRRALEIRQRELGENHLDVAEAEHELAWLVYREGQIAQAEELFRHAAEVQRTKGAVAASRLAITLGDLAMVLDKREDWVGAESKLDEALALLRSVPSDDSEALTNLLNNVAIFHFRRGNLEKARSRFEEILELDRKALGDEHPFVANDLSNLAMVRQGQGDLAEAEDLMRQAVSMQRALVGDQHYQTARFSSNLSSVLMLRDRLDEAEQVALEALTIRQALLGEDHQDVAISHDILGDLYEKRGDLESAEQHHRSALAIRRKTFDETHSSVTESLNGLAAVLRLQGKTDDAALLLRQIVERYPAPKDIPTGVLRNLAALHSAQGDSAEAQRIRAEVVDRLAGTLAPDSWELARARSELGAALTALGRFDEAERELQSALDVLKIRLGVSHRETRLTLERLLELQRATGDEARAQSVHETPERFPAKQLSGASLVPQQLT